MDSLQAHLDRLNRRQFFGRTLWAVGSTALASLLPPRLLGAASPFHAIRLASRDGVRLHDQRVDLPPDTSVVLE